MLEIDPVQEILERSFLDHHDDLAVAVARPGHPKRAAIEAFVTQHELQAFRTRARTLYA